MISCQTWIPWWIFQKVDCAFAWWCKLTIHVMWMDLWKSQSMITQGCTTNRTYPCTCFPTGRPASLRLVNKRLLSIRPPHCFTRLPRALSERGFWKASEWRLWLLFYSLPCTINILPDRYWRHLSKLSEAIYILLSTNLNESRIKHAGMIITVICHISYYNAELLVNVLYLDLRMKN